MATLSLAEIKVGKCIVYEGDPYIVEKSTFSKLGRQGANNNCKIRNLKNGNIIQKTFSGNDSVEKADMLKKSAQYLYKDGVEYFFMDNETYEQFTFNEESLGEKVKFMVDGMKVDVQYFEDNPISVEIPAKVELLVTDAPPGVKGDSATGATKQITLETGLVINAPLFINTGDKIRVNTDSGSYVERV